MEYVILATTGKVLVSTKRIPIFKGEKNMDQLKFLFPICYDGTVPTLQIILPDGKTGKVKMCAFEQELYKEHLVCRIPITEDFTAYSGKALLWFIFLDSEKESLRKTNLLEIEILDHQGFNNIIPESDIDIVSAIVELKTIVADLKTAKADNVLITNNNLVLRSGDESIASVQLPENVTWSSWD